MIVYVESNFVLELALGQEELTQAEEILRAAERGDTELALPQFCLSEPFSTLAARGRELRRLSRLLSEQLRQLGRSSPHQPIVATLQATPGALLSFEGSEIDLLGKTVERLLSVGQTIALDSGSFQRAIGYRGTYSLSTQDATIYACIVAHMSGRERSERKCFVSRNFKDFDHPGIRQELSQYGCEYADSFEHALRFIRGG